MAILIQGILGPFSGKVGPVVGCICRRKGFYVRSLPVQYHDAKTPAQLRNRARMRAVMEFLSVAKGFVNHTLGNKAERMTATNVATKLNFHKVEVGEDYAARIRYGEVRLSEGGLSGLAGCVGVATRGFITLCWEGMACVGCGSTEDGVDVFVYDETRHQGRSAMGVAKRGDGGCAVRVPEEWEGDALHVYVVAENEEGSAFSEGQYFGFGGVRGGSVASVEGGGDAVEIDLGGVCFDLEQSAIKEVFERGQKGMCPRAEDGESTDYP